MKKSVLILCTGNSNRSQMAEGVMRHYGSERFEIESAGTLPSKVNRTAIKVMAEIGIDISGQHSKHVRNFKDRNFDYVITVCPYAEKNCPAYFKRAKKIHWGFPDPPHGQGETEAVLREFRMVREMIHEKFKKAALTDLLDD